MRDNSDKKEGSGSEERISYLDKRLARVSPFKVEKPSKINPKETPSRLPAIVLMTRTKQNIHKYFPFSFENIFQTGDLKICLIVDRLIKDY